MDEEVKPQHLKINSYKISTPTDLDYDRLTYPWTRTKQRA